MTTHGLPEKQLPRSLRHTKRARAGYKRHIHTAGQLSAESAASWLYPQSGCRTARFCNTQLSTQTVKSQREHDPCDSMQNQINSNSETKEPEAGARQISQQHNTQCESDDTAYQ